MPTSVLLALLAATGLFVLAPALVRRYDATERLTAERRSSSARLLSRQRRRRTVPGRGPINPPRTPTTAAPERPDAATQPRAKPAPPARRNAAWGRARRRRVLAALVLLLAAQITGVVVLGPGFWVGLSLSAVLLIGYVAVLRTIAGNEHRRRVAARRAAARRAAASRRRPTRPRPRPVTRLIFAPPPPDSPEAEPEPPPRAANM